VHDATGLRGQRSVQLEHHDLTGARVVAHPNLGIQAWRLRHRGHGEDHDHPAGCSRLAALAASMDSSRMALASGAMTRVNTRPS